MKTLILCVDRDDDLGQKANVATPVVGRRRCVEAALALGLADPEDSDTNALLAAVHLYDQELKGLEGGDQVEVACVAGHKALGLKADRRLAQQLQEILDQVRPDEAILVSDGAEDEQILPVLQSRVRVAHVHRSIVKQAPRLEGFYYTLTRMLDEPKQARRFVLPFAIILLFWGVAYLFGLQNYAWGATLAFVGTWLVIHAMKWEGALGRFFGDLFGGVRQGRLTLIGTLLMVGLLAIGGIVATQAREGYEVHPDHPDRSLILWLAFAQAFLPFALAAVLAQIGGRLFDAWVSEGRAGVGHWTAAFTLIALGLIVDVSLDWALSYLQGDSPLALLTVLSILQFGAGLMILMGGILVSRYVRSFFREKPTAQRAR